MSSRDFKEWFDEQQAERRTGAGMKRGQSKQDNETPDDFMAAVVKRFGPPFCDLAATLQNAKCENFLSPERDSLKFDWTVFSGVLWLNPPFADIAPWARKCLESVAANRTILLLTPASVGANWYRDFVHDRALCLFLNGRLKFKGEKDWYPKDCMLSVFGIGSGHKVWSWRQ
jgi:phage N-6-adenine-methyltransferase